jgi:hypothetical protein
MSGISRRIRSTGNLDNYTTNTSKSHNIGISMSTNTSPRRNNILSTSVIDPEFAEELENTLRRNTDYELEIVEHVENAQLRVGRPSYYTRLCDFTYKTIYYKYSWNSIMLLMFLFTRLMYINYDYDVSIYSWYNDTLFFIIANNYIYKRIHWNNVNISYFNTTFKGWCYIVFLLSLGIFTILNINMPHFYLTKTSVEHFDVQNTSIFYLFILYVIINQCISVRYLYKHDNKLIIKQLLKYILLLLYVFMERILDIFNADYPDKESFFNQYHFHHWICGLFLIVLTELNQPYHTMLQYVHFSVYLHGAAVYSYTPIIT